MGLTPSHISRDEFLHWRIPYRGTANPSDMTNDVWVWLIEEQLTAYTANELFDGPSGCQAGPCWCFTRFGQSRTLLPDGRRIFIAGEHEDFYDPDFFIYNDVVVVEKSGEITIFGYPADVFPPTDFHTATLFGNSLILIGNLSYPDERVAGYTQVLRLELDTWRIDAVETSGNVPGWISDHKATLCDSGEEILITGGLIDYRDDYSLVENIDDWLLDLRTWRWKRLTKRPWTRFEVFRKDKKTNHLWRLRSLLGDKKFADSNPSDRLNKMIHDGEKWLKHELGKVPDLTFLETLYAPEFATEIIPQKEMLENDENEFTVNEEDEDDDDDDDDDDRNESRDELHTYRIRIGDVIVRYVEDIICITVTIEGELPQSTVEQLKKDLMEKFKNLELCTISCHDIPSR